MKKNTITLLSLVVSCFCSIGNPLVAKAAAADSPKCAEGVALRVSSYNIRYAAPADEKSGNGWALRKAPLAALIKQNQFDIVGTQEGNFDQMADLKELLPEYDYVGHPYAGRTSTNHTASIVYKKDKYEVLDKGVFWFSETPDKQSIGWDATDTRICTWARMKDKPSGQEFYFFTAHFYWRYVTAKQNSGPLMVRMVREIAKDNLPVICTGDYNSAPSTSQIKAIKGFLKDARDVTVNPPFGPEDTNLGGGNFQGEPKGRIDYVFVNDRVAVLNYVVLSNTYDNGRHPSDHLPVVCDVILKK